MSVHHLIGHTIYCCRSCYNKYKESYNFVKKYDDDGFCICTEIRLKQYNPQDCEICYDPTNAACPAHLNYIMIFSRLDDV